MQKFLTHTTLALGLSAGLASPAFGVLLASDDFDGYTAGNLSGQTSTTATGFAGAWAAGSANIQAESGGILDGDPTNGQGRFIPVGQAFPAFRTNNNLLNPVGTPSNNTFYMSHLVNAGTSGGLPGEYAFTGFGSFVDAGRFEDATNFLLGAFTGFVIQDDDTVDLVIRSRTGALVPGAVTDEVLVEDAGGNTFNVVMALEFNNPGDEIRYWVNPTNFFDESTLTATAAISGSIGGFQLGAESDLNRLSVGTTFTNRSFFFDEALLGTESSDLGPIPEPTSLALLGLGGLAMLRRKARA
ncbi:MAG: PEP-CTERM sorting domain-containing protein [Planctomycetota bacterium]